MRPRNLAQKSKFWGGKVYRYAMLTYIGGIFVFALLTLVVKAAH